MKIELMRVGQISRIRGMQNYCVLTSIPPTQDGKCEILSEDGKTYTVSTSLVNAPDVYLSPGSDFFMRSGVRMQIYEVRRNVDDADPYLRLSVAYSERPREMLYRALFSWLIKQIEPDLVEEPELPFA